MIPFDVSQDILAKDHRFFSKNGQDMIALFIKADIVILDDKNPGVGLIIMSVLGSSPPIKQNKSCLLEFWRRAR